MSRNNGEGESVGAGVSPLPSPEREAEYDRLYDVLIAARRFIADKPEYSLKGALVRQSYYELKSAVEKAG